MLTPEQKQQLEVFYNNLTDTPLDPTNDWYLPVFNADDKEDPISDIAVNIRFAESASVNLLSGPRGSGKSTELKRLSHILETEEDCTVFHCDMSGYMNMTTPVGVTDFLISMMAALSDAVKERYNENFTERGFFERLNDLLQTEREMESTTIKTGFVDIKGGLKNDPSFKILLQQKLKGHINHIVSQAHDFAAKVVSFVRKQQNDPNTKVVMLVDSVEKVRGEGPEAALVYQSIGSLLSTHAPSLQFPMLHILYTIPPYISALLPSVGRTLGGNSVQTLPSVHVRTKGGDVDIKGLDIMLEMVKKRFEHFDIFITPEQVHELAKFSGGDLRNFFRLVRSSLIKAMGATGYGLPVAPHLLEQVINLFRREIFLTGEDVTWLKKIHQSNDHHLVDQEGLPHFVRFLDSGLVLNYRNGEDWYGVNPLIQDKAK